MSAWERHRSGEWHGHMLVANTRDFGRFVAMAEWEKLGGYARVFPPSSKRVVYVVKYVVKGGAWDVFGNWERDRQLSFR